MRTNEDKQRAITAAKEVSRDWPLTANGNGQWSKKVRGRVHYFGAWNDPEAALSLWLDQKDDLLAGRKPRDRDDDGGDVSVGELCYAFLANKSKKVAAGELTKKSLKEYERTADLIVEAFGKSRRIDDVKVDDFDSLYEAFAKRWSSPVTRKNNITRVRVVFNYAFETQLVDRPFRFGQLFRKPSEDVLRKDRATKDKREFNVAECRDLLSDAPVHIRAMILLALNCGFGNRDIGKLNRSNVDLVGGWIRFPRPKTGKPRRAKLWPETVDALRLVADARRDPTNDEDSDAVFLTRKGFRWSKDDSNADPIAREFKKLTVAIGIYKGGVGFYALRHTFAIVAGETRDAQAVDVVMGHADASNDVRKIYKPDETVGDDRIADVCGAVRVWLFGDAVVDSPTTTPASVPFEIVAA